jgi:hypothetical protein
MTQRSGGHFNFAGTGHYNFAPTSNWLITPLPSPSPPER